MLWHDFQPQNKCRSQWPITHGPVILSYILETIWIMNLIFWDIESVFQDFLLQNKCDLHFSHFALYLEDYLLDEHHTLGLWVGITFNFIINVGHSDLYVMVQWFCPLSWRLMLQDNITVWNKDLPPNSATYSCLIFLTGAIQASYAVKRQPLFFL